MTIRSDHFRATIWAEVEHFDKVLAVALHAFSLNEPTRDFLAAGTEDGTVTVTELLMTRPFRARPLHTVTTTIFHRKTTVKAKRTGLGDSLTVHRQGRIRLSFPRRKIPGGGWRRLCVRPSTRI
jgi:hypothetical protein